MIPPFRLLMTCAAILSAEVEQTSYTSTVNPPQIAPGRLDTAKPAQGFRAGLDELGKSK